MTDGYKGRGWPVPPPLARHRVTLYNLKNFRHTITPTAPPGRVTITTTRTSAPGYSHHAHSHTSLCIRAMHSVVRKDFRDRILEPDPPDPPPTAPEKPDPAKIKNRKFATHTFEAKCGCVRM